VTQNVFELKPNPAAAEAVASLKKTGLPGKRKFIRLNSIVSFSNIFERMGKR
jgi:hypothetical protein